MTFSFLLSYCLLWILVVAQIATIAYLARQLGLLYMKVGPPGARLMNVGPRLNEQITPVQLRDIGDREVLLGIPTDRDTLVIFLSPSCSICFELAKAIPGMARAERKSLSVVVVSRASRKESEKLFTGLQRKNVSCVISEELWTSFQVALSPYALLINKNGQIAAKGLINNLAHLESILNAQEVKVPSGQAPIGRGDAYELSERTTA